MSAGPITSKMVNMPRLYQHPSPSRMPFMRIIGWGAFLLAFLGVFEPCSAQGRGPRQVEVMPVVEREAAPTIRLVGTVRPRLQTTVASEVEGLVTELPVDEGDFIKRGEVICKLRDVARKLDHAAALGRLEELRATLRVQQAELKKAEFEEARTERLWKQGRSTDKERNDTLADFEAARGRVDQARFSVAAQSAAVDRLADDVARTRIRSPYDGYVTAKQTEVGSWVGEGGEIVSLVDLSTVRIRVNVPEAYIRFCGVGAEVSVTVEAVDETFGGHVSRVIPFADERARTFPIDIDIANPKGRLMAGMFVRAMVPSGPKTRQLLVPKDAVLMRGATRMVYVVRTTDKGQMAVVALVEIVAEVLDCVAVKAPGLSAGDQGVVRGNEQMRGPGPVIARPHVSGDQPEPDESSTTGDASMARLVPSKQDGAAAP